MKNKKLLFTELLCLLKADKDIYKIFEIMITVYKYFYTNSKFHYTNMFAKKYNNQWQLYLII